MVMSSINEWRERENKIILKQNKHKRENNFKKVERLEKGFLYFNLGHFALKIRNGITKKLNLKYDKKFWLEKFVKPNFAEQNCEAIL